MNEAIELNNQAVAMMVAGDDHTALTVLKRAVGLMKATIRWQPPTAQTKVRRPPEGSSNISLENTAQFHSIRKEETKAPTRTMSPSQQEQKNSEDKNTNLIHQPSAQLRSMHDRKWFLYNKALYFDIDAISSTSPFVGDIHTYCAVVIFNLALVYHRNVLRGSTNCIGKAVPLYTLISKLLGHNCTNSLTATVVKLAAINNLAQLRYAAGYIQEGQERLIQLSLAIRSSRQTFKFFQSDESDLKGFSGNVMLLQAMPIAPAA
jgi:hypothetical protein